MGKKKFFKIFSPDAQRCGRERQPKYRGRQPVGTQAFVVTGAGGEIFFDPDGYTGGMSLLKVGQIIKNALDNWCGPGIMNIY